MNTFSMIKLCGAQRLGLRAALLPLFRGSPAAAAVPAPGYAETLSRVPCRCAEGEITHLRCQQGWLEKAAAGLPQSKGFALVFLALVSLANAGPRTSASYTISAEVASSGGSRTTSAAYTHDGSAGGIIGISSVTTPAETMKHGYIAQLTDGTALQIAATPTTINEGTTRQLIATATLDDATTSALLATDVMWSVQSGPLTSISTSGLATAATVYQNTAAIAQGVYSGFTSTLDLTVVNTNTDDIPGYSGDGLDDAWQVQYFGLNNPLAAPTADADHDGQDNRFEFTAGVSPISSSSHFILTNARPAGQPGQMNIVINPRFTDRTYTVMTSPTLGVGAVWTPLTGFTIIDNGTTRTITDTSASGARKFYRVDITKP